MVSRTAPGPEALGGRRDVVLHRDTREQGGAMRPFRAPSSIHHPTTNSSQCSGTIHSLQLLSRVSKNKTMAHKLGRLRLNDSATRGGFSAESLARYNIPMVGYRHTFFKTVRACVMQLTPAGFSEAKGKAKAGLT